MSKSVKIPKEDIVKTAFEITKDFGVEAATARAIAERLNCSIQPVYYVFDNMENLRGAVLERTKEKYSAFLHAPIKSRSELHAIGVNYVRFARDFPHLFRLVYCSGRESGDYICESALGESKPRIIQLIQEEYGIKDYAAASDFYTKLSIFLNGICFMLMNQSASFTDSEISKLICEVADKLTNH